MAADTFAVKQVFVIKTVRVWVIQCGSARLEDTCFTAKVSYGDFSY